MHQADTTDFEHRLAEEVAGFYADPLGFVRTDDARDGGRLDRSWVDHS